MFAILCFSGAARAQSTWSGSGADGNWQTSGNWNALPAANSALVFGGSTQLTNTNNFADGTAFGSITFSSTAGDFFLTGNLITLGGGISTAAGTQTMAMNLTLNGARIITNLGTSTLILTGVIDQDGDTARNLAKVGAGTLVLDNAANTFTGQMQINQGTVRVTKLANTNESSSIGAGTGAVRLGQGINSGTLEYVGTGDTTDRQINIGNGDGTGSSTILNNGSGALVFNNAAFNVPGNFAPTTTNARSLSLGGTNTGTNTIAGVIANTGSGGTLQTIRVVKQDAGTWVLSANNSYTGGTTLSAGTLRVGNDGALGTGTFTINGGVFASDGAGGRTITNAITMTNTSAITVQFGDATGTGALTLSNIDLGTATRTLTVSNITTVAGAITNTGGLTKAGEGTLTLSGANTYSGGTTISGGTLELGNGGSVAGNITNNATLSVNRTDGSTMSNVISGSGTLAKSGAGTLTLTASNSYSGGTTLSAGTLMLGHANALSSGAVSVNGGTLDLNGLTVSLNNLGGTGGTIALGGGALTANVTSARTNAAAISGTGTLTKAGAGTLVLAAANVYAGDTFLQDGRIQLGVADALPTTSVLRFSATNTTRRLILQGFDQTLAGLDSTGVTGGSGTYGIEAAAEGVSDTSATLTLNVAAGQSFNFGGLLRNAQGGATNSPLRLVKDGAGTQVLSGTAAGVFYAGTTTVNAGVLEFAGTNSVANNSSITVSSNGTVRFSGGGTRDLGVITGTGTLEKTGANTLTLARSNSFSGGTLISAGTLRFTNGGSVAGNITNNAELLYDRSDSATVGNTISGTGILTKAGAGTLVLAAANVYAGDTFLQDGRIQLGVADALSTTSVLRFSATNTTRRLILQAFDQTLAGLDSTGVTGGSGTYGIEAAAEGVSDSGATLTLNVAAGQSFDFGGMLRNAQGGATNSPLRLVKDGAGTQVLSGTPAGVFYAGTTTVNAGVLEFAGTNSVANNSSITVSSNGTVRFSGGGTRNLGVISGTGTLEKTGANTLTLARSNSFSGAVSVQAGLLELNSTAGAAAGSAGSVSVASGAILLISQSDQVNETATVSLSGGTIQRGTGVSQVFGNLNITGSGILDFGTGVSGHLTFGTYQDNAETPSALLTLNNFLPGNSFTFGSTSFTEAGLGNYFTFGQGFVDYSLSSSDSTFTITAIPEPSTYLAAAGLLGLLLCCSRRRPGANNSPVSGG